MNPIKKYLFVVFLFNFQNICAEPKIVGLIPSRNESPIIEQCLRALSLYTDAIVCLDDASTDNTLEIVKSLAEECNIEKIIAKEKWYRDEPGDRNKLLQAGRKIGGTHFIVIDADEMLTANFLENDLLRKKILQLKPGETIKLTWIQLWRSLDQYRFDNSVWTNNYKDFIFCDDGKCSYNSEFIHTPRTPKMKGKIYTITGYTHGMLHFQFVNWRNLLIKQSWYRCLERIRLPNKNPADINRLYAPSKDEKKLGLKESPFYWFDGYKFFDPLTYNQPEGWREKQMLEWFEQYGREHFANLDIWDVEWGAGCCLFKKINNHVKSAIEKFLTRLQKKGKS